MQGNTACAEGAIAAGCRFFAGYPITPSTEIAERMALRLPHLGGIYIQMEDEMASLSAVIGASWAGVKSMTATSGPGFSLMQENIGYAFMTETPCVIVNVQRGGPSTGQPTRSSQGDAMQSRWGTHGDYMSIVLSPNSVQEMFYLTIEAFNLSEKYRTPVVLLSEEIIAHMWDKVTIPKKEDIKIIDRKKPKIRKELYKPFKPDEDLVPPMAIFGEGYRIHITGLSHDEDGKPSTYRPEDHKRLIERLHRKIEYHKEDIVKVEKFHVEDSSITIITYGACSRSALRTVNQARKKGKKVGLLRLITLWPFPTKQVSEVAEHSNIIIVPEMNLGQIYHMVRSVSKGKPVISFPKLGGELHTPSELLDLIERVSR